MSESIKNIMEGLDKLISFENIYLGITILEIVTGKEILAGTPNDFGKLMEALVKEYREAGEDSVWYNPSTWKLFDFIGDLQAQAVGIDRDEFDWSSLFSELWGERRSDQFSGFGNKVDPGLRP